MLIFAFEIWNKYDRVYLNKSERDAETRVRWRAATEYWHNIAFCLINYCAHKHSCNSINSSIRRKRRKKKETIAGKVTSVYEWRGRERQTVSRLIEYGISFEPHRDPTQLNTSLRRSVYVSSFSKLFAQRTRAYTHTRTEYTQKLNVFIDNDCFRRTKEMFKYWSTTSPLRFSECNAQFQREMNTRLNWITPFMSLTARLVRAYSHTHTCSHMESTIDIEFKN